MKRILFACTNGEDIINDILTHVGRSSTFHVIIKSTRRVLERLPPVSAEESWHGSVLNNCITTGRWTVVGRLTKIDHFF